MDQITPRRNAPGPQLSLFKFLRHGFPADTHRFFLKLAQQYGDVVRIQVGPWSASLITHPDGIRHVLQDNGENYRRSHFFGFFRYALGNGLLTSDGDWWRFQRRLVQPAFQRQQMAKSAKAINAATTSILNRWQTHFGDQAFDIASEMTKLTLAIVGNTMLRTDLAQHAERFEKALSVLLEHIFFRCRYPLSFPEWIPTPGNIRVQNAVGVLRQLVDEVIQNRRSDKNDTGDLLSILLNARREETGEQVTDRQIRDQVMTFILTGVETTSVAFVWIWYLLARHPRVEQGVRNEVDDLLGSRIPTMEDLPSLTYTRMVIEEVMRLYPPIWMMSRQAIHEDEIDGNIIPANSLVLLSQYVTHRHPEFWEDPDRFAPERFSAYPTGMRPRFSYFPFGGGQRVCIGNNFAMTELVLAVVQVVQRGRLDLEQDGEVELHPVFALRPLNKIMMRFQPVSKPTVASTR